MKKKNKKIKNNCFFKYILILKLFKYIFYFQFKEKIFYILILYIFFIIISKYFFLNYIEIHKIKKIIKIILFYNFTLLLYMLSYFDIEIIKLNIFFEKKMRIRNPFKIIFGNIAFFSKNEIIDFQIHNKKKLKYKFLIWIKKNK